MGNAEIEGEIQQGVRALAEQRTLAALAHFEKVCRQVDDPVSSSCLGYCIAKERGQLKKGIELCRAAQVRDPDHPLPTLNLARILLLSGYTSEAVDILREGIRRSPAPELSEELARLGQRKPPIFPFLKRDNLLNMVAGIVAAKLGLRGHKPSSP